MSHQPERAEKDCLNCGIEVAGRFCQRCGQENIVTRQSAWSLFTHFIYDIFHFDGKFFDTLRYLLTRPGRVPREYVSGKRQKYLDPIRMYLFTSAVFFLIFFGVSRFKFGKDDVTDLPLSKSNRFELAASFAAPRDSFERYVLQETLDTTKSVYLDHATEADDSTILFQGKLYEFGSRHDSGRFMRGKWVEGDSWLQRFTRSRVNRINEKVRSGDETPQALIFGGVLHRLPYLLFVSLPFFGLLLKLLYIRRKQLFYSEHMVFTLYLYIFSFMLLLFVIGCAKLKNVTGWGFFNWLMLALFGYGMVYLYEGMRRFYGQGWKKTLGKFLLLNVLAFFMILLLFVIFLLISAIQI